MSVEVPSGKGPRDENFPVGSWLIARRLRPHVAVYYAFARVIDDIADNAILPAEEKIKRLDRFANALTSDEGNPTDYGKAHALRETLKTTGIDSSRGLDLVDAFRQDAVKLRYRNWAELIHYCDRSAAPVGRFLLDLHGENPNAYGASDALCNALQVLNHLQDCKNDYRNLNRVYLPLDWLEEAGASVEDLNAQRTSPKLRRAIERCLDGVDSLLADAAQLPSRLRDRRLAMEASVIFNLARRLARRLRDNDPLADRVALSKLDFVRCGVTGIGSIVVLQRRSNLAPAPAQ